MAGLAGLWRVYLLLAQLIFLWVQLKVRDSARFNLCGGLSKYG